MPGRIVCDDGQEKDDKGDEEEEKDRNDKDGYKDARYEEDHNKQGDGVD